MNRIQAVFAALLLLSMVVMAGAKSAGAQDATPISVPTPLSAGCDQIPAYAEARGKIMNDLIDGIGAIFPEVATPITDHADQLTAAMMNMTPDQYGKLAALYNATADKIEKLDVPEIAKFYNDQLVELYRISAKTFDEAKSSDLATVGMKYGSQLGEISNAISAYGDAATVVCPAFAQVTTIDRTQVGG